MNNNTLAEKIMADLLSGNHPLRLAFIDYTYHRGIENLVWWHDWKFEGKDYDVNIFHNIEEDNLGIVIYEAWFDGNFLQTNADKAIAYIRLENSDWRKIVGHVLHNIELTITLRLPVSQEASSEEQALSCVIERFDSGELDIAPAFEHCLTKAVITDKLPKIGDKRFTVNVLESRSRDIQVYAASADEAEDLVRNHLHTHFELTTDDLIGYDVMVE